MSENEHTSAMLDMSEDCQLAVRNRLNKKSYFECDIVRRGIFCDGANFFGPRKNFFDGPKVSKKIDRVFAMHFVKMSSKFGVILAKFRPFEIFLFGSNAASGWGRTRSVSCGNDTSSCVGLTRQLVWEWRIVVRGNDESFCLEATNHPAWN